MMTSALYAPHVAVVSPNHMASEYSVMKEKFHAAQAHGGYVDKYLAKLMYCRPISDSESLPEKTVREKMRTIYSDKVTSSIADSAPRNDSSKELSSGLQQVEINDRTIPTLPARDAGISNETGRPISDSESLPEKTVREKMRTIYSDKVTSSIADSAPRNDSSKELSSGLQQVEINDRTIPTLPARDAGISNETEEKSKPHPPKCECGCIPKIPSLFEMAELRRQHRERIKNSGKS